MVQKSHNVGTSPTLSTVLDSRLSQIKEGQIKLERGVFFFFPVVPI